MNYVNEKLKIDMRSKPFIRRDRVLNSIWFQLAIAYFKSYINYCFSFAPALNKEIIIVIIITFSWPVFEALLHHRFSEVDLSILPKWEEELPVV